MEKLNLEQLAKQFVRKNICPKCLEQMKKDNPKMIDCAFRHNNDEHLCTCMTPKKAIEFAVFVIKNIPHDDPHEFYTEFGITEYLEDLANGIK